MRTRAERRANTWTKIHKRKELSRGLVGQEWTEKQPNHRFAKFTLSCDCAVCKLDRELGKQDRARRQKELFDYLYEAGMDEILA